MPKIAGRIAALWSFVRYFSPTKSISEKTILLSAASIDAYLAEVQRGLILNCVYRRR